MSYIGEPVLDGDPPFRKLFEHIVRTKGRAPIEFVYIEIKPNDHGGGGLDGGVFIWWKDTSDPDNHHGLVRLVNPWNGEWD
jgi:hypothetical protein